MCSHRSVAGRGIIPDSTAHSAVATAIAGKKRTPEDFSSGAPYMIVNQQTRPVDHTARRKCFRKSAVPFPDHRAFFLPGSHGSPLGRKSFSKNLQRLPLTLHRPMRGRVAPIRPTRVGPAEAAHLDLIHRAR